MVADDHVMVRSGLRLFLLAFEDLKLVGEASNGEEAVRLCHREKPDVILMDMVMPVMDGVHATLEICSQFPHTRVIGLTTFYEPEMIQKMLDAGAISFLLKSISATELAKAIRDASDGKSTISSEIQDLLKGRRPSSLHLSEYNLSEREREVLACIMSGMSNAEIARELIISISTAKFHVSSILDKLNVSNRAEAVSFAMREGLISSSDSKESRN
ncbi:MAG: response regulator transcription factor [Chloroflexi bacterium]|nr:response regulator transcription factor [Chloroflexota bacterium]